MVQKEDEKHQKCNVSYCGNALMMIGRSRVHVHVGSRKLGILQDRFQAGLEAIISCDVHLERLRSSSWRVKCESWFKSGGDIVWTKFSFGVFSYPPYDGSRLTSLWFRPCRRLLEVNLPRVAQLIFIVKGEMFSPFAWGFILHWILLKFSPVTPAYWV